MIAVSVLTDLSIETGENRAEEGILNQSCNRFPGAGLRRLDIAGHGSLGRNFLAGRVGQQRRNTADQTFVEFSEETLFPILAAVVYVHIAEQRLYVAVHFALPNFQVRIERKLAGHDVDG